MAELRPEDEELVRRYASWKHRRDRTASTDVGAVSAQQVYAHLMKAAFGPSLRQAGLRGSSGRFEVPSDVYWAQLGFQKSAFSDGQEIAFTVNLSVIRRDAWIERAAAEPHLGERPTPTFHYGTWADQTRIGSLTPGGQDKWWRIVVGANSDTVRDDAMHDLLTYAVPWLRQRML